MFIYEVWGVLCLEEVARYPDLSNLKQDFEALVNFIDKDDGFIIKSENESI
jgi:hypothetical protein